jgi:hypothetical protein
VSAATVNSALELFRNYHDPPLLDLDLAERLTFRDRDPLAVDLDQLDALRQLASGSSCAMSRKTYYCQLSRQLA